MNNGERRGGSGERQGQNGGYNSYNNSYNNRGNQNRSGDFRGRSTDRPDGRRRERPAPDRRYGGEDTRSERRDGNRHYTGAARRTYAPGGAPQRRDIPGSGPRVGAIYRDVPRSERVDASVEPQLESVAAPVPTPMEENENLLVGRNPIREALKAGRPVEKLLVARGDLSGAARDIIRLAREAGAVVQTVDRSRLDQIYPAHQGMLAYVAAVESKSLDDIFDLVAQRGEEPFIVLLDGVTDPHNLGAIIRSAECAGAHGVVLPERRSAGLGPAAAKAAAGALDCIPIARVKNLNRTIDELKARGVWVVGSAMNGENALSADLSGPVALVVGSEGDGISHLTLEKCDRVVTLPMSGRIESLNASVAAGILMYEIVRARKR